MPPRRKASGLKKKTGTKVKKAEVQLPTDAAQLAEVLGMMAVPDNDILAQAVRILRKFIETPACVPALMQQLTESPSAHTRQLSAILLHKRMRTHWPRLTPDLRSMIRSALLSCLPIEENRNVRNSTVGVISSIAQHDLKNKLQDEWPELIPFVFQGTSSADIKVQESCMFLLTRLVKRASSALEPHAATVKNTCLQLISSTEPRVRNYAIKGVDIAFSRYLEADEIGLITQVVAALITLVPTLIEENDDNSLMSVFSVFYNSSGPMIPITDEALTQIWTIMNTLMVDAEADMRYRAMAATLCVQILRARPGVITRLNLAAPLVQTIAQIVVEFAHDVFDSEQETTPQSMALDLIMPMMATLPQDQVFTAFLPCIMQYLISEHELHRKGGLVLLASLSNGCTDVMLEYEQGRAAAELARHAVSLLSDPSVTVRTAACLMICNNAESLSSILVPMHAEIMQRLLSILANPAEDSLVHRKCCMALEAFTNELGEDLNAYADAIIGEVQRVFATTNLEMHVMMISVLRSVADVMGKAFLPHFAPMMAIVRVWLTRDEEEFITIRARATECIGHMASAVGVVNWDDSVPLLFKFVIEGFTIDDSTLHDLSFVFMRKIVEAWGANTPKELVTPMLQLALAQINSSDGFDIDEGDEEEGNIAGLSDSSSDDDEADTDPAMSAIKKLAKPGSLEDGEGNEDEAVDDYTPFDTDDLRCNVPALEAKLEAFRLVQQSLTSLGDGFENDILEDLLNASLEIMHMPFAPLRTVIVETFGILVEWLRNNHPLEDKWVKGTVTPLPETHASLVDAIRDAMCETIIVDTEPSVVAAAMGTYGLLLDVYGMAMLPENDPEDEEEGQVLRDLFIVLGDMAKEDSGCQVRRINQHSFTTNSGYNALFSTDLLFWWLFASFFLRPFFVVDITISHTCIYLNSFFALYSFDFCRLTRLTTTLVPLTTSPLLRPTATSSLH